MSKPVGRPPGVVAKPRGSQRTHKTLERIAACILDETREMTVGEAAEHTGLERHDVKNLRAGTLPSLQLLLRFVTRGRYAPDALIVAGELRKLPARTSTQAAQVRLVGARIRKLAQEGDAATLARATGLSIYNIYQLRAGRKAPGIHAVLGFIDAGAAPNHVLLGQVARARSVRRTKPARNRST